MAGGRRPLQGRQLGLCRHLWRARRGQAASIIQLLLGNIGRPGGGILALRGHANIQGSTDIPTLYDILPGYIPQPHPNSGGDLDRFIAKNGPESGAWGSLKSYTVSLLKAWWGDAATEENDFCFGYLPRIDGDHSHYAMTQRMLDGRTKGFIVMGQNPVVGSANSGLQRKALANLDWLVVRDTNEIETAAFWYDTPQTESGEQRPQEIGTEVFFLPAAAHREGRHLYEHPASAAVALQGGRAAAGRPLGAVVRLPPHAPHPREARRLH